MKYWRARKLSATKFKRFSGVKRQTFRLMVRLVKAKEKHKKKPGRPSKLIIEDQIFWTLDKTKKNVSGKFTLTKGAYLCSSGNKLAEK